MGKPPPARRRVKIGELERELGVTRDQVHHYVELGLVPPPEKSSATVAWYGPEHRAAVRRVRAIRDAGGSLAQAGRWLSGALDGAGRSDCAALTNWVIGDGSRGASGAAAAAPPPPLPAVVAMIDAGLSSIPPESLVHSAGDGAAAWMAALAERWVERAEHARLVVAAEALASARTARRAAWLPIDPSRVEGGVLRAASLDRLPLGADPDGDEERARLGVMLPSVAPVPLTRLPERGGWSAVARAIASMRAGRWAHASAALENVTPGAPGATLGVALGWCNDALQAASVGDGILAMVPRLGDLRAIDASATRDIFERLRVRWTLAVTWLALPVRWAADRPVTELTSLLTELAAIPSADPLRATGELQVIEANARLALTAAHTRSGDRAGALDAARPVLALGGAAAREAARAMRRAARAV